MKELEARTVASAAVFAAMLLLLSACQKSPALMTMIRGNTPDSTTAPAASGHHVPAPALQPYDPTPPQPEHDFPSMRPRPGMPHPALVKEAKADVMLDRLLPPPGAVSVPHVRGRSGAVLPVTGGPRGWS